MVALNNRPNAHTSPKVEESAYWANGKQCPPAHIAAKDRKERFSGAQRKLATLPFGQRGSNNR